MKIAICVGHSRRVRGNPEGGAVSASGISEHELNSELAGIVQEKLKALGIESVIFDKYVGATYSAAMTDIARQVKKYGADIAMELHANSSDSESANGYEFLCYETSTKARRLAILFLSEFGRAFPASRARGVKLCNRSSRGSLFLRLTHCPAIITEPFFLSNKGEYAKYLQELPRIAEAYTNAIQNYFKG
jgi:N-acetylmuramoyl-L-alanine amidase